MRGIALDIDSFGGEVAGAFDLADRIRAARTQKPIHAFVAEHALSAGCVIAYQADRIILPRTGDVGSIGVVALHTDMSGAPNKRASLSLWSMRAPTRLTPIRTSRCRKSCTTRCSASWRWCDSCSRKLSLPVVANV